MRPKQNISYKEVLLRICPKIESKADINSGIVARYGSHKYKC